MFLDYTIEYTSPLQRSYWLATHPLQGDTAGAERRAGLYIDRVVDWLRGQLFSHVPWYQHCSKLTSNTPINTPKYKIQCKLDKAMKG